MTDVKQPSADGIDLSDEDRTAIDHFHALRQDATHYELLGVAVDADRKTVRDAYFALSKRFHPDVYFKREIGPYRERVEGIFRALTRAYDVLGNAKQRAAYDQLLKSEGVVPSAPATTTAPIAAAPPASTIHPPPHATPPAGMREIATQTRPGGPSPLNPATAPTQAAPSRAPSYPQGVVVPPSLRSVVEASPRVSHTPSMPPPSSSAPVDEAVRARALEAMARRLGAAGKRPAVATAPAPAMPSAQQIAEERAARVASLVQKGEECQKANDLGGALEAFKNALQIAKDDAGIKARIDAITQLGKVQVVADHIEKAKEATRERNLEAAAMHWEKAWEGRREDPMLLLNAAEILARLKEYKRAAELAQRVIAMDPKLAKAHQILATVFTEAGLRASARSAIENLARLDPNHASLKELREKLGPMSIAEQFGLRGSR